MKPVTKKNNKHTGRPTKYKKEYCQQVKTYLEETKDEYIKILKTEDSQVKCRKYEYKLKVNLPSYIGFAKFLGISIRTLHDWKNKHEEFLHSVEDILAEQKQRLIEKGLSNDYNSGIVKLLLISNHGITEKNETIVTKKISLTELFEEAERMEKGEEAEETEKLSYPF